MANPVGDPEARGAERLAAAEGALERVRARERLLQAVLDHTYQFIGVLSLDGILLEVNRSALALIGADVAEVAGKPFPETPWWTHSPALQALRASRAMLALVLDTIPVRVFWKDLEGRYLGCNTSFARDAGVESIEEVVGKNDFDLGWRAQAELYRSDDRRVTSSGMATVNYEEPQTSPTGEELWLRTSKIPLRDVRGVVVGVLGVYETSRSGSSRRASGSPSKRACRTRRSSRALASSPAALPTTSTTY
jgi:PAS domain S-box-containing protein